MNFAITYRKRLFSALVPTHTFYALKVTDTPNNNTLSSLRVQEKFSLVWPEWPRPSLSVIFYLKRPLSDWWCFYFHCHRSRHVSRRIFVTILLLLKHSKFYVHHWKVVLGTNFFRLILRNRFSKTHVAIKIAVFHEGE